MFPLPSPSFRRSKRRLTRGIRLKLDWRKPFRVSPCRWNTVSWKVSTCLTHGGTRSHVAEGSRASQGLPPESDPGSCSFSPHKPQSHRVPLAPGERLRKTGEIRSRGRGPGPCRLDVRTSAVAGTSRPILPPSLTAAGLPRIQIETLSDACQTAPPEVPAR